VIVLALLTARTHHRDFFVAKAAKVCLVLSAAVNFLEIALQSLLENQKFLTFLLGDVSWALVSLSYALLLVDLLYAIGKTHPSSDHHSMVRVIVAVFGCHLTAVFGPSLVLRAMHYQPFSDPDHAITVFLCLACMTLNGGFSLTALESLQSRASFSPSGGFVRLCSSNAVFVSFAVNNVERRDSIPSAELAGKVFDSTKPLFHLAVFVPVVISSLFFCLLASVALNHLLHFESFFLCYLKSVLRLRRPIFRFFMLLTLHGDWVALIRQNDSYTSLKTVVSVPRSLREDLSFSSNRDLNRCGNGRTSS